MAEDFDPEPAIRSSQAYVNAFNKHAREANKENRLSPEPQPSNAAKRKMPHEQNSGSQDDDHSSESHTSKRQRLESEETPDDAFQTDHRVPDPHRRRDAPVPGNHPFTQRPSSPPEMIRNEPDNDRSYGRVEQSIAIPQSSADTVRFNDDDERVEPRPSYQVVKDVADFATAMSKSRQPQRRIMWSKADEDCFISLIEKHGTSWSFIAKNANFEVPRDQVALKDKARNMKATFLK